MRKFCPNIQFSSPPLLKFSTRGFTLIELLVVIAIIGILTGGAIAAYNNFSRGQTVRRAAQELKSDLRESQNRAVSGVKHENCRKDEYDDTGPAASPADNIDDYDLKGHFVAFDESLSGVYQRAEVCSPNPNQATPPGDITPFSESISFPSTVAILDLRVIDPSTGDPCSDPNSEPSSLTINFKSLKGIDFFAGTDLTGTPIDSADCQIAEIQIREDTNTYAVEVNKSGQIIESEVP